MILLHYNNSPIIFSNAFYFKCHEELSQVLVIFVPMKIKKKLNELVVWNLYLKKKIS